MATAKVFAREIVEYSDAELDRYLAENGRLVHVHDPENLPESFIDRLRDRVRPAPSRPVDLDQVSARLLQIPAERKEPAERRETSPGLFDSPSPGNTSASWPSSQSTPPARSPEAQYLHNLGYEKRFYNRLVKYGGRPWYPIDRLEEVSRNPKDHRELLLYWQGDFPRKDEVTWCVYGGQWGRWRQFLEWQVRRRKEFQGRLPRYNQWAKKRLAKHSFTRPFEFDEDPKRQDRLTTWIEYTTFECMWYDRFAWYKRREQWYRAAWKKLVDSEILRPNETDEYITGWDCGWQREREGTMTKKAVEDAKAAVSAAQQVLSSEPSPSAQQRLTTAQSRLDAATEVFESFMKRNNLIEEFNGKTANYLTSKRFAERHWILLRWVQDQIPLIESEMKQHGTAESSQGGGHDGGDGPCPAQTNAADSQVPTGKAPGDASRDDGSQENAQAEPLAGAGATAAEDAAEDMEEDRKQSAAVRSTSTRKRKQGGKPGRPCSSGAGEREDAPAEGPQTRGSRSKRGRGDDGDERPPKRLRRRGADPSPERETATKPAAGKGAARTQESRDTASAPRQLRRSARAAIEAKPAALAPRAIKDGPRASRRRTRAPTPQPSSATTAKGRPARGARRGASKPAAAKRRRRA